MQGNILRRAAAAAALLLLGAAGAQAHPDNDRGPGNGCRALPGWHQLKSALQRAVADESSGLDLQMWATLVDRDGVVCAVAFSGADRGAQWPGSRVISAQKANAANAFSLQGGAGTPKFPNGLALSTANLYAAVQPGGSLFGLPHTNPVDTDTAYGGNPANHGQSNDYMVGRRIGGVNVFGGGVALYNSSRKIVGGLGVSGDTSCADHMIGWRLRRYLDLDFLGGLFPVSGDPQRPDNIVFDIGANGVSAGGFGHPTCLFTGSPGVLPPVR
ncbi:heme-binding protein [Azohydromonas aeria]|uniref:heme-binding protein n=1 Tax=Azohydromonas aeria TaxID=2590212 RepID=UPI0012F84DB7|nr:heme-binding protein [Azohydromonas aeria]